MCTCPETYYQKKGKCKCAKGYNEVDSKCVDIDECKDPKSCDSQTQVVLHLLRTHETPLDEE